MTGDRFCDSEVRRPLIVQDPLQRLDSDEQDECPHKNGELSTIPDKVRCQEIHEAQVERRPQLGKRGIRVPPATSQCAYQRAENEHTGVSENSPTEGAHAQSARRAGEMAHGQARGREEHQKLRHA
ncbi:MAG: hypothetical protein E6I18_05075 [Chloroflexi bacterium]|nr:MAG: hypothetical protein E6I18_05075 [Chloroflexota bacterium]